VQSDYGEHLDAASLRLLAETTGFAPADSKAGWVATDESAIDLNLLTFSGQTHHQQFVVGLLASYLKSPAPAELVELAPAASAGSIGRFYELIELCSSASATERAGALRLLGDEALFASGICPSTAHDQPVDDAVFDALSTVLPRAVNSLMHELRPQLRSLLDIYLMFGSVWYRMAAQNLLYSGARESLSSIAADFSTARRFIVQVAQGPLSPIKHSLYPESS